MTPPNIVFLLPDQLRQDFLSCYGARFIRTPHMDGLAQHGVRFANAFSASPVCVPARTALLTGMNALRNGVTDNLHAIRADYQDAGIRTWPQILADAGYYTASVGKMHFYPWDESHGFQYVVRAEDKRWLEVRDDYYEFLKRHGLRKLHGNEHDGYHENQGAVISRIPWEQSVDHFVGEEACRFIENYGGEQPFAMMVGFPGPHCPYDPSPDYPERFDPAEMPAPIPEVHGQTPFLREANVRGNLRPWNGVDYTQFPDENKRRIRAHYCALIKQIDHEVGRIVEALRSQNLLRNTVIVLSSDHGDYLGDHDLIGKASFYESAIRVPLLVRLPRGERGTRSDLVELRDTTATMLRWAGLEVPPYMDAQSLPGVGISDAGGRDRIFGLLTDGWMNFDGRWKLARYASGEVVLFDMENDPQEQRNLINDTSYQSVRNRLEAELAAHIMESTRVAMHDRLAHSGDLSQDPRFGKHGWERPDPGRIDLAI